MAMVTKCFCDKCGAEVSDNAHGVQIKIQEYVPRLKPGFFVRTLTERTTLDSGMLCDKCYNRLITRLTERIEALKTEVSHTAEGTDRQNAENTGD